MNGKEEEEDVV